ncbi:MAG TPA: carboxypeptidase-like regulatory domain-containing protein [Verrucomicrobiae bacterium]|nr:carboxypeptidase-like regulatory domain-containing protein [Verrucomicrobiae bacterium]
MKRIIIAVAIVFAAGLSLSYIHSRNKGAVKQAAVTSDAEEQHALRSNVSSFPSAVTRPTSESNGGKSLIPPDPSIALRRSIDVTNREQYLTSVFQTPIDFFGRVVDEKTNAIPAAQVRIMVGDRYPEGTTTYQRLSDENGFFSLIGVRGATLSASVVKDGYYPLEKGSVGFTYAMREDPFLRVPHPALPTPEAPAILVLKRIGKAETLVHLPDISFPFIKDGTPLEINLAAQGMPPAVVKVEAWIFDPKGDNPARYDWRCSLSIPAGGFIERKGRFEFEAPVDGYQEFFEFAVFADTLTWRVSLQKEFFVRFGDNRFARLSFHLSTRPRQTVTLESFLNPTPGSCNLEYDASKVIEISRPDASQR